MEKGNLFEINRLANSPPQNQLLRSSFIPSKPVFVFLAKNLLATAYSFTNIQELEFLQNRLLNFMKDKKVMIRTDDYANPDVYASRNRNMEEVFFENWYHQQRQITSGKYPPYLGNFKI